MESEAGPGPPEALIRWSPLVSQENPAPESGGRAGVGVGEYRSGLRTPLGCAACGPAYLPQPDAGARGDRGAEASTKGRGEETGNKDIRFQQLPWPLRCQQNFDQEKIGITFCFGKT